MADIDPIEVQRFLGGVDYPAGKQELVEHARAEGAGDEIVSVLDQLPDPEYDGPDRVS